MKKFFIIFLVLIIGLILIKANIFQFDDHVKIEKTIRCTDNNIEWMLQVYSDGNVAIQPLGNLPRNVIIPETLNGYTITQISDYAFMGYSDLRTVECPATITYVGNYAFADCASLVSVIYEAEHVEFGENIYKK